MQGPPSICPAGRRTARWGGCVLPQGARTGLQRRWPELPPAAALSTGPSAQSCPAPHRSSGRRLWVCILAPLRRGLWLERLPWTLPSWSLAEE